jgi:hypothetical protein
VNFNLLARCNAQILQQFTPQSDLAFGGDRQSGHGNVFIDEK